MEFSHHLFLIVLLLPLVSCADPAFLKCSQNFTDNSKLQDNINNVINTLLETTPASGYAVSTVGTDNDTTYSVAQCRGDIGSQACSDCVVAAAQQLRKSCPNSASSLIGYEFCFIRYENRNFLGSVNVTDLQGGGTAKMAENPTVFNEAVWQLLNWIKEGAVTRTNTFGMGKRSLFNGGVTIYGMAQCRPDLGAFGCTQCFGTLSTLMNMYCTGRNGCSFSSASNCALRYEIYVFLQANNIPDYEEGGAPAPSPYAIA